ncbi:RHS repeat domain-containing protein [Dehalogenimonas sp. THU2]|uniref:RHS repeat domain-containing protein n=1 Tax=Dehalogenimonas sp. THU2 TaxID=3151121 RepID=UPI00321868C2
MNFQTLEWDAENHLISISDGTGVIAQYVYDGNGKRVKEIKNMEDTARRVPTRPGRISSGKPILD